MSNVIEFIEENKIIAIVRGVDKADIIKTAQALYDGGIKLMEVTFNQNDPDHLTKTPEMIKLLVDEFGDKMCIGAGTVMNIEQCQAAINAGAKYMISPNVDESVIKKTKQLGAISIPGALTPTEAANAHNWGADFVKLFPAGNLGKDYIKSLCAPLNHIKFLAVGGISDTNIAEYMSTGILGVGVGGGLVNVKAIKDADFEYITKKAVEYIKSIK